MKEQLMIKAEEMLDERVSKNRNKSINQIKNNSKPNVDYQKKARFVD